MSLKRILISCLSIAYFYWIGGLLGVSIILMIALHELGHLYAAKLLGYENDGFILTPLGGLGLLKWRINNFWHRFIVAWAGPLVGFLLVVIAMIVNYFWNNPFVWKMAGWWAFVNLFNLLPIYFLDGGQIFWCIGNSISIKYGLKEWFHVPAVLCLGLVFNAFGIFPCMILILFSYINRHNTKRDIWNVRRDKAMSKFQIITAILIYISLVTYLVWCMITSFAAQ
ncbi:MAG: site-2 protease family protein [Patescibacteria group bacterium]